MNGDRHTKAVFFRKYRFVSLNQGLKAKLKKCDIFVKKQNIMCSFIWSRLLIFQSFQKVIKIMRHLDDQTHIFLQQKTGFLQPWSQFQASKIVNNWAKKDFCFLHQNLDSPKVPEKGSNFVCFGIESHDSAKEEAHILLSRSEWEVFLMWWFCGTVKFLFCYLHQNRDSPNNPESAFEKALFWFSISFLTIITEIFTSIKIWIENLLHVQGNAG